MIHSYSSITQYENCPHAFHDRYVLRTKYPDTQDQAAGIAKHALLQHRIEDKSALPAELASAEPMIASLERRGPLHAEMKLAIDRDFTAHGFFGAAPWVRAVTDLVCVMPEMTLFVGDWKTGKVRETDTQLLINAITLMALWEKVERVIGANLWLRVGKVGTPYVWRREDLPAMRARLMGLTGPIESATTFPKKPSPLCGWCPVVTCEHNPGQPGKGSGFLLREVRNA